MIVLASIATVTALAVIALLVFIGLVTARLLAYGRPPRDVDWLDAPFLGMALIVTAGQNAVYAGVPLRSSAWMLLVAVIIAVAVLCWRRSVQGLMRTFPVHTFLIALGVYALHAFGLGIVGVEAYLGRGWGDQINYSALAHYLTDEVYSTVPPTYRPAAILGQAYTGFRIGQSVLLGFASIVFGVNPKVMFEPVILLAPFLLTLAACEHGKEARLPRWLMLLLAAFAGCLPAVASVHLESFLSQALAIPALLYFPVLLARASVSRHLGDYARAALVFAATASTYLEYFPLLAACAATFVVVCSFRYDAWKPHAIGMCLVIVLPILLQATRGLTAVMSAVGGPILGHIFPWALSAEGIARIWIGDLVRLNINGAARVICRAIVSGLVALGYFGLWRQVMSTLSTVTDDRANLAQVARSLCALGIATFPLVILLWDSRYVYHYYKSFLLAAPLLAWGAGYSLWLDLAWLSSRVRRRIVMACLAPVAILSAAATADMVIASSDGTLSEQEALARRQVANAITLDNGFLAFEDRLEKLSGHDVFLCLADRIWTTGHVNGWFALAARHNRVWALNPHINDQSLSRMAGDQYLRAAPASPDSFFVVTANRGFVWSLGRDHRRVKTAMRLSSYELFQPGSEGTAFLCNPWVLPQLDGSGALSVGPDLDPLVVYSSHSGPATFFVKLHGVSNPTDAIRVEVEGHPVATYVHSSELITIPLTLTAGITNVRLIRHEDIIAPVPINISFLTAKDGPKIASIENPNGVELKDGQRFFWIGGAATVIDVLAPVDGTYVLELQTLLGPSVSRSLVRRLRISDGSGTPLEIATRGGTLLLHLAVTRGRGRLSIEALDQPDTIVPHDPRPLILGVEGLSVSLDST